MDKVHAYVTSRLRALYGDPKTPDLKTFMAEYSRALKDFDPETLTRAVSEVIDRHTFLTWPTPGEIKLACMPKVSHSTPQHPVGPDLPPPTHEQRARVEQIVQDFRRAMAEKALPTPADPDEVDVSRPAFRQMQRKGDLRLHMTHEGLTNLTRRMTGEHNE